MRLAVSVGAARLFVRKLPGTNQEQTPLSLPAREGNLRRKANKSLHFFRKQHFIRGAARRQRYLPKVENVEIFGLR